MNGHTRRTESPPETRPLPPADLGPPAAEGRFHGPMAARSQAAVLGFLGATEELPGWTSLIEEFKSLSDDAAGTWSAVLRRFEAEAEAAGEKARAHNLVWVESDLVVARAAAAADLSEFDAWADAFDGRVAEATLEAARKCALACLPFDPAMPQEGCAAALRPRSEASHAADLRLDISEGAQDGPFARLGYGLAKGVLRTVTGAALLSVAGLLDLHILKRFPWAMAAFAVAAGCAVVALVARGLGRAVGNARDAVDLGADAATLRRRLALGVSLAALIVVLDTCLSAKGLLARQDMFASLSFAAGGGEPSSAWAYLVGSLAAVVYVTDAAFGGWKARTSMARNRVQASRDAEARALRSEARGDEPYVEALAACNAVAVLRAQADRIPARRAELERRGRDLIARIEERRLPEDRGLTDPQIRVLRQLLMELRGRTHDYYALVRAYLEKTEGRLGRRFFWWLFGRRR